MRKIQIAFIGVVLILILCPLVFFNGKGLISKRENRYLATHPKFVRDGKFNSNFFNECNLYASDRFGMRNHLISLNAKINHELLHGVVFTDSAIEGKDGWLFYTDTLGKDEGNLYDFFKRNLMTNEECAEFRKKIENAVQWCKNEKIPFIFLLCPNKHSVYSEYYPFVRPDGISRADQVTAIFDELGVPYIFPRDYLINKKSEYDCPLYYETDGHWNPLGAYLTSRLFFEKLKSFFPTVAFPEISYNMTVGFSMTEGDLMRNLATKLDKRKSTRPEFSPVGTMNQNLYTYLKNDLRNGVQTKGAQPDLPRALIFRDSFFIALEPFVSPFFSEAEYIWKNFSIEDEDYVRQYKPDIIVFEAVERYALRIVSDICAEK